MCAGKKIEVGQKFAYYLFSNYKIKSLERT